MDKLQLSEFNNLAKTLNLNIYKICYARVAHNQYTKFIDDCFNALKLRHLLVNIAEIVGATILNIAQRNYTPQGASATMMIAEGKSPTSPRKAISIAEAVVAHLDKSHVTAHTYPENCPTDGIQNFRIDIDVSTCGKIPPLRALKFILENIRPDVAVIDYRIRGFTRSRNGIKLYNDYKLNSITDFLPSYILDNYHWLDINMPQENTFQTKMELKHINSTDHILAPLLEGIQTGQEQEIIDLLRSEMREIFLGKKDHIKQN